VATKSNSAEYALQGTPTPLWLLRRLCPPRPPSPPSSAPACNLPGVAELHSPILGRLARMPNSLELNRPFISLSISSSRGVGPRRARPPADVGEFVGRSQCPRTFTFTIERVYSRGVDPRHALPPPDMGKGVGCRVPGVGCGV
jgi:hypothetical protein